MIGVLRFITQSQLLIKSKKSEGVKEGDNGRDSSDMRFMSYRRKSDKGKKFGRCDIGSQSCINLASLGPLTRLTGTKRKVPMNTKVVVEMRLK